MFGMVDEWTRADEFKRANRDHRNIEFGEFETMVQNSLPNWSAVWHLLAKSSREKRSGKAETEKTSRRTSRSNSQTSVLQKRIQKKIQELVREEEILVNLYTKAAEAAKKRQEEFRDKTAILLEQIEKDRYFLRALREVQQEQQRKQMEQLQQRQQPEQQPL